MTTAATSSFAPVVRLLDITDLKPAEWNARKSFDPEALAGLRDSIAARGVQVPLLVRPVEISPEGDAVPIAEGFEPDAYEIVAGHRRYKAALAVVDIEQLPCIVRNMSDGEAREAALVDNLQRENVPAMEEAIAFSELLTRLGSVEAVAARVQKDQGYVAKRLKLCSLSLAGQHALKHRLITVDHALVLARLGADEQDAALKWGIDRNAGVKVPVDKVIEQRLESLREDDKEKSEEESHRWRHTWEPQSVQALKDHIASESGIPLDRAPWDLDAAVLIPDAVACNICPQNTKANSPLFGDLEIGEATCTDGGCFREKTQAFVQIALNRIEVVQDGNPPLRVSWKSTSTAPRMEKDGSGLSKTQTFKSGQWIEAKKKSCEHVRAAVTVDWSDGNARGYMDRDEKVRKPGEILQVCVEPKCKVHAKEYAKPRPTSSGSQNEDPKVEAERREKMRLAALAETRLRVRLAGEAVDRIKKLPEQVLRQMLVDQLPEGSELECFNAICPGVGKILSTAKLDSIEFARAFATATLTGRYVEVWEHWQPLQFRKEFIAELKALGYDASKAWEKPKAEKPAPAKAARKATATKPKKAAKKSAAKKGAR